MRRSGLVERGRRLLPALLVGAMLAGVWGATVVAADDAPPECAVSADSLSEAKALYAQRCSLPRIDCDKIQGIWYCSSRVIGDAAPGGVSGDDVGRSKIGRDDTTIPSVPTTATPTTQTPITEAPPSTTSPIDPAPPTTATPTTPAPPTTQAPPTTDAPTTTTTDDGGGGGGDVQRVTYPKNAGPERNPMKGWNSGWSDDRLETTVGFQYIGWKELEPRNGSFDFAAVEDIIARPGSKDRHLILRLYCDWWGENEASRGCPDWIYSEVGVDRIRGDNGRYITDYNDPRYIDEAIQAIEALGERYDDDPRVYAVQIGVLGYWGEWHTWGSQIDGESYEITRDTETRILDAYRGAFDRAGLMARYPDRSILATADDIGFHNDYFRPANGHSAEFDEAVSAGERWRGGPIGGEVPPGLSSNDYNLLYATPEGRQMIETGHYSTMKPGSVSGGFLDEHLELHKRFGYNYQIDEARFAPRYARSEQARVQVDVANIGIAPFYHDWDVQFSLLGADDRPVVLTTTSHDLRSHLPGEVAVLNGALPLDAVASGQYRLGVRMVQPGADQAKPQRWGLDARNTYILFANELPSIDGSWNERNQLVGGWSVLGTVAID